jgi:photosystem II stability/assembly factor-like uncharacterized protein
MSAQPRLVTEADFKRLNWRSIGPAVMAGRVTCMAWAPNNPKSFFIGYATGGLWKTVNYGTTFTPIFDKEATAGLGSVAVCDAPADWKGWDKETPKKDRKEKGKAKIIWIGTGEGNGRNSSSWGDGVYRSTDGGKTWTNVGLKDSHDLPSLAVDPRDPDTCYAGALGHLWGTNKERGVYKTTDGGQTWKAVLQIDDRTGCIQVQIDPKNPDIVYAAMYARLRTPYGFTSGGPKGGLYKSTDAGKTWKKLTKGLPEQTGRIGFDIFAADPNVLVACVQSNDGGTTSIRDDRSKAGGVFRSEDGGQTWERQSHRTPRAFYFSKIYIDPKNSQRIYNLGWWVEVSDDGGKTFRGGVGEKMHVDMHAFLINPADTDHLINGSDGGAYQSFDGGKTWAFFNTMAVGQFYNVSCDDSDPYRLIGGLQDNGTWVGPSSGTRVTDKDESGGDDKTGLTNADWHHVLWGDGFHADFDPTDPNSLYAEWQGGNLCRMDMSNGDKRRIAPDPAEGQPRIRFNWNTPFFVSKHDPTVLYMAGNHVYRLTDRGDKWSRISDDLTTNDPTKIETVGSNAETYCTIVSLAESDVAEGLLWAGSDDGLIHVTEDRGKTWKNVTPKAVGGLYVSRIEASHTERGTAYVTIDGHRSDNMDPLVLMTKDLGKTWTDITGNLPKGWSTKVIREDLANPDVLYVGTEQGIFVSLDRGSSWLNLRGKNFPTVPVEDIKQHPRTRDLILATHGRSLWILDDASFFAELTGAASKSLHLFPIQPAKPRWLTTYGGLWTDSLFRASNRPQGAVINYWLSEYTGEDVKITIENEKGLEVASLTGTNAPGWNRVVWDLQPKETQRKADGGEEPWLAFFVPSGEYKAKIARSAEDKVTFLFVSTV